MSKRLLVVSAFLLPLLPLLAYFLLEARQASNEVAAVERMEPQTAMRVSALPDGSEVLIEGRLDAQNTKKLDPLVLYIAEHRYLDVDLSEQWAPSQVVAPLVVALPDGFVRVINQDYDLKNPLHTIDRPPLQRYSGLALGDRVTVIGIVTHDVYGAALQARVVSGGTRVEYVAAQRRSATAPESTIALWVLVFLLFGAGLWLARKQTQRNAQVAL
jgi:hypothetical protein